MTWTGEQLAKHLARNASTQHLRDLCDQIKDPDQRQIVMDGLFADLGVVDKLAFIGEFGGTPKTLAEERGEAPIERVEEEWKATDPGHLPYLGGQR